MRCWNYQRDYRSSDATRFFAVLYERRRVPGASMARWRTVRRLCQPSIASSVAIDAGHAWGAAHGVPWCRDAAPGAPAPVLSDYVSPEEEAAARLGGLSIALLVKTNYTSWTVALCFRQPDEDGWTVRAHLGTGRAVPSSYARQLGLQAIDAHKLSKCPGARVMTKAQATKAYELGRAAAALRREKRSKAQERARKRRAAAIKAAENAGDEERAARLRTGKGAAKRKRAARKAAHTRKKHEVEHARRSAAAKRAAKTRRENAERRAAEHARRSAAAKRAWQHRRTRQENTK